jgi:hypothetical protein
MYIFIHGRISASRFFEPEFAHVVTRLSIGTQTLARLEGRDATLGWNKVGHSEKARRLLEGLRVEGKTPADYEQKAVLGKLHVLMCQRGMCIICICVCLCLYMCVCV